MTALQTSYPDLTLNEINLDNLADTLGESTLVEAYAGNEFGLLFYSRESEAFDIELILHSDNTLLNWMEPTHAYRLQNEGEWYWYYAFSVDDESR